jgi:hypothetical protein
VDGAIVPQLNRDGGDITKNSTPLKEFAFVTAYLSQRLNCSICMLNVQYSHDKRANRDIVNSCVWNLGGDPIFLKSIDELYSSNYFRETLRVM